jgi:hypothetical protein
MAFAALRVGGNATSLGIVLLVGTVAGLASYQVAGVWADRLIRSLVCGRTGCRAGT